MIKKNLIPKTRLVRREQPNSVPTAKKKLAKLPVEDIEEDDDELTDEEVDDIEEDDDEVETPVVKKKLVPRSKVVEDEVEDTDEDDSDEEEVLPKRKAGLGSKKGKSALAKAFDSVPLSNSAENIPAGKHECIIREARVHPFNEERGQNITFKYEFCADPHTGKQMTQWFKILDANNQPVDWMIDALHQSLVKMGIDITGEQLEDTIQEINDEHPGILLKLTYVVSTKDGNTYPRFNIQGQCNNDVVEAYKDNVRY